MATTSIGAPGVVFPDGTTQATASPGITTGTIYYSPTTYTKPAALKAVKVTVLSGGGGGGGGGTPAPTTSVGGSAGGGAYGFRVIPAASLPASPIPVAVGAGGTGGAINTNGTSGGTSSFSSFISATGGGFGGGGAVGGADGAGGSITPSPTTIGLNGIPGAATLTIGTGAAGGGWGFYSPTPAQVVSQGWGYGGPGGAKASGISTPASPGVSGASGFVIIEEYF